MDADEIKNKESLTVFLSLNPKLVDSFLSACIRCYLRSPKSLSRGIQVKSKAMSCVGNKRWVRRRRHFSNMLRSL